MLRVLDLFSGIGGFSLGLERTGGFETVAFCEIDPFCRCVLAKHWPGVPIYDDVRTLSSDALARDGIGVDVICGGFPCQDVSHAGKRAGLEGARSGLWSEYARIIGELRPRFVIVENVPGLLSLGMGVVLGDLSEIGYDATWDCVSASAVGAPHRRDRVWIIAHPDRNGEHDVAVDAEMAKPSPHLANANGARRSTRRHARANHQDARVERSRSRPDFVSALSHAAHDAAERERTGRDFTFGLWRIEPDVGRVAHGVPNRVDRLRALGNAVVPQIPELIGRAILSSLPQAEGRSHG